MNAVGLPHDFQVSVAQFYRFSWGVSKTFTLDVQHELLDGLPPLLRDRLQDTITARIVRSIAYFSSAADDPDLLS
eukprot:gene9923-44745_t